ncbi:MAG: tetratricopeptide repeat protein, partial [Deltaproteobacteria bacterium]
MDKNKAIQNAQKYVQKGQLDKAIREYQKVIEADPKDVRTRLKIGDLQAKKGDTAAAVQTYLAVAEAYSQQGFFLKAVAVYKQILKLNPNQVDVNLKLAELYHQLGLMSDAMAQYQLVANYYEQTGNTAASFETLKRMLDLDPDNVASRIKLAEMYSRENMKAEAIEQFQLAADYLKEHNRIDDYIKVVERLIYHDPANIPLTRDLANIYLTKGDTKRALAKLQVCFKANPQDTETLYLLARAFQDLGQINKTLSVYKEMAKIYGDQGDIDQQRAMWKKVLELAPGDPDAQAALGQRPEAAAVPSAGPPPGAMAPAAGPPPGVGARMAAAPAPPAATAAPAAPAAAGGADVAKLLTETDVYVKYGLHDKAIEHLKKVFAIDPKNLAAHEKAKEIFLQAGNLEAAGQELVTLIQLVKDSDPERARTFLGELWSTAPHLPEVEGFVQELGLPEGAGAQEQGSFLHPAVPASDEEVVIAAEEDEVLVADTDDFGGEFVVDAGDDAFLIEDDAGDTAAATADPFVVDTGVSAAAADIELDEGSDGAFVIADDGLEIEVDGGTEVTQ